MNRFAELPGEANPLTPALVYSALQSAGSNQQLQIQSGTQQLQKWETQKGFYALLQAIYMDKSLPTEVRYLAIIQLKNGIDKYFRKTAVNAISPDERQTIRSNLLDSGMSEAEPLLAVQTSLVISKVIRLDWPLEWPEALTELIAKLRVAADTKVQRNTLPLRRSLLILLQVVKELSTARLKRSQTSLQSVTPEIVYLLSTTYLENVQKWTGFFGGNGNDEGGAMEAMESSLYCLKILRRLLIAGYEQPHHDKDVQLIWAQSQQHFGQFLDLISREPPILVSPALTATEKHLFQLAKLHLAMSEYHPASFAMLPDSVSLCRAYWGLISKFGGSYSSATVVSPDTLASGADMRNTKPAIETLALKGLNILRACMKMVFKPTPSFTFRTVETKREERQAVKYLQTELLTGELVLDMASTIVTKFFVFRQVDLEAWDEEPDEWEAREEGGGDTWQFEIRACSERLFMDLVLNFKELLLPPLLAFFGSVANESNLQTKDSVYTAMGLSAAVVYKDFDFDNFLINTLTNDLRIVGPGCKILRRRIAILIAQWVTVKIDKRNSPLVHQIFLHLLDESDVNNDQVVRITAARQFKAVVDDFEFNVELFLPYAAGILSKFMSLMMTVEFTETKMAILDTLRTTAARLDQHIAPFADDIVKILPALWEASGEEHLMKQGILSLLSTLFSAVKQNALRYNSLVLPLVHRAVEPGSDMQVYLLDEALELWLAILEQTPVPASPEMMALFECTFPLLEFGSENLAMVLNITKQYILLCPELVLGDTVRLRLMSHMTSLLGTTKRELSGLVVSIVERMIRTAENLGGANGVAAIGATMMEAGFISKVMDGLHDAWEAHQTTGPNKKYAKLDDVVETDYWVVLSRFALGDPNTFFTILQAARVGKGESIEQTWDWVSTEWFQHMDCMANIERQKLSCLALTRLFDMSPLPPCLLNRLQDYFSMWTSLISELQEDSDDLGSDNVVWIPPSEPYPYETHADIRTRTFLEQDPVHSVNSLAYIKEKLQKLVGVVGGEVAFKENWASNVDQDVLKEFGRTTGISLL